MESSTQDKSFSVLLLYTHISFGGAQKLMLEQAQWMHERGHRVKAVFFYDKEDLYKKWRAAYPFPLYNLSRFNKDSGWFHRLFNIFLGMWNLWKILRAEKFDMMLAYTHDSNLIGLPLAWMAGIPSRVGTHLGEIQGMPAWRNRLHTLMVNLGVIQALIASSARTRQNAIDWGIRPELIKIVYNSISPFTLDGIDRDAIRARLGLGKEDVFLLTVGRLAYEKGHELLIRAMSLIADQRDRVFMGICGGGYLYQPLTQLISDLHLENRARMLGQWEDVRELLAAADIFVLPSRWEGLPMALLEAMMASLPVISTRVEGVEEVIENGVQGLLVPLENVDELAKAILQLSAAPEQRQRMGAAARLRVLEAYTTDQMCRQYLSVMLECLNRQRAD